VINDSIYKILLVIPCYNDVERLKVFLPKLVEFLPTWFSILVSDDGSNPENRRALGALIEKLGLEAKDGRAELLSPLFTEKNTGKGGAILCGWACSDGFEVVAFTDADGAVGAEEILRAGNYFRSQEAEGLAALFASRVKMLGRMVERSLKRHLSGRVFATLVSNLGGVPAYDTQCGLKFVKADAYKKIAPFLQCQGFAFDVELCLLLRKFGFPILEFPVDWRDVPGSKVSLLRDSWRMALEVRRIVKRVKKLDV
jgi:glycosyltransferase involved in cell wall biosynthesis